MRANDQPVRKDKKKANCASAIRHSTNQPANQRRQIFTLCSSCLYLLHQATHHVICLGRQHVLRCATCTTSVLRFLPIHGGKDCECLQSRQIFRVLAPFQPSTQHTTSHRAYLVLSTSLHGSARLHCRSQHNTEFSRFQTLNLTELLGHARVCR